MTEYRVYQINDMRLHAVAWRNDLGFMNFSVAIEADKVPSEPEPIDPYKQANLDADLLMQLDEVEVTLTRLESERNALDVSYHAAVEQWRTVNASISPARRRRV